MWAMLLPAPLWTQREGELIVLGLQSDADKVFWELFRQFEACLSQHILLFLSNISGIFFLLQTKIIIVIITHLIYLLHMFLDKQTHEDCKVCKYGPESWKVFSISLLCSRFPIQALKSYKELV